MHGQNHIKFKEVLLRVNEQRNILREINKRKANRIGHILRRNCLLQGVIEGKIKGGIEVTGRRGRRRRKLLDDLKERRGYSHLKEEALECTVWRACFGRGFGPVVRQNTEWMNEWMNLLANKWVNVSLPQSNETFISYPLVCPPLQKNVSYVFREYFGN